MNNSNAQPQHTEKFAKALSVSNTVEIVAGIFVITTFSGLAYLFRDKPVLLPVGCLLFACGGLFIVLFILAKRVRRGEVPPQDDLLAYYQYWVIWYENTYALARKVFWWYLLPMIPGAVAFTIGFVQLLPEKSTQTLVVLGSTFSFVGEWSFG